MQLSICIVNYNTRDWLERCLTSIQQTIGNLTYEIIIVDNGSVDGSVEFILKHHPSVKLITPEKNTFYSEGNNIAIEATSGDYVLILNPDTEVHPDALTTLVQSLDEHPTWGAVTAHQLWIDGKTTLNICSQFNVYKDLWLGNTLAGNLLQSWRNRRRTIMWYADWDRQSNKSVDVIPGSCMLIRNNVLTCIGVFDPSMPMYFSDDDLCRRIKDAGWEIWYVATASITHAESASVKQISHLAQQYYQHDMYAYTRKYFGRTHATLLIGAAYFTTWLRQVFEIVSRISYKLQKSAR